ncbi:MAG: hypothetical protein ACFFAN_12480 [Promethearchaeota archaeon]
MEKLDLKNPEGKKNSYKQKKVGIDKSSNTQKVGAKILSEKIKVIKKNKDLFKILLIFEQVNTDEENVMFHIKELTDRKLDIYNKVISNHFKWSDTKTKRVVDRLTNKKLIEKIDKCPKCGKKYNRIPKRCENKNCSMQLIRQDGLDNNKSRRPQFIIRIRQEGINFIMVRLKIYYKALSLYSLRLSNFRSNFT